MSHPLRTTGALLAAGALSVGLLAAPSSGAPSPATPAASRAGTDSTPSELAAEWLKGELTNGLMVGQHGPDYGLTLDAGMALSAVSDQAAVNAINAAFEPKVRDYIGDGTTESYGGSIAKAATFARMARKNPTSYGGVNLITELEARTADAGTATAGRLSDKSAYGDYANVIGQSYAVQALSKAGSSETQASLGFLLAQQCASGYFRLNFARADAAAQGCVEGDAASSPDPDATALAVINLVKSGQTAPAVQDALVRAGTWLAARQRSSGSVRGGTSTAVINSNSTSVAGYALALVGNRDAAMKAARWVRGNQPVDKYKCRTALTKETGAVAYRWDAAAGARTGGISKDGRDEWRRATAQAVPALLWAPKAEAGKLQVQRTKRQARAGSKVRMRVFGLAPGERGCLQVKGTFKRVTGNKSGSRIVRGLVMPSGNKWQGVVLKTADERARTWIKVRN